MKGLLSTQLHFDGVTVLVIQLLFSSILQQIEFLKNDTKANNANAG
jgi:hypothetical protein